MSRFLSTIPTNHGFVNLGKVEAYPTGGTGPTAFGPTSYFGSDPRPPELGDNLNNPIDLGDFNPLFSTKPISGTHGGLTRRQSTFYKFTLNRPRSIQVIQNFSTTAYTKKTNRNTLIAFYKIEDGNLKRELPVNDEGYLINEASIDIEEYDLLQRDYPTQLLQPGNYLFVITNDIRYQDTEFSISINGSSIDWRFINEAANEQINFGNNLTDVVNSLLDFGSLVTT
mgnify:FL=1|tara:strand:- start:502 stop:1179 length:678 start_codon:yes stop_codon:yes gene_type:complete